MLRRWRRGPAIVAALAVCLLLAPGRSRAQSNARARELFLAADFNGARSEFEAVLDRPSLSVADALEAHRHLALILSSLGDSGAAREHAAAAVALAPEVTAPEGSPAAVAAMFEDSRAAGRARITIAAPEALRVRASLSPAPPRLAARIALRCTRAGGPPIDREATVPEVEVALAPGSGALHCSAAALTRSGAELVVARWDAPHVEARAPLVPARGDRDEDASGSVWPWIAVGAVAAALVAGAIVLSAMETDADDGGARITSIRVGGW